MKENMSIKTVAILGAGAVGSYMIWGLAGKSDVRLGVIAEGARAKRLKNNDLSSGNLDSAGSKKCGFSGGSIKIWCIDGSAGQY